ncbi:MAG: cysteine desulfurase-like protein [Anaerolineae bacterium]
MNQPTLDLSPLRQHFPSLQQTLNGEPVIYLDTPGGSQVPQQVVEAMTDYLRQANANVGGAFLTSQRTAAILTEVHQAMADFLNAPSADEIVFGPNMTTLTFAISRSIGQTLQPGDEIVVTRLDHDANIAPWVALEERGVTVRQVDFHPEDCTLDMDDLAAKFTDRTRLVAVGYASNAVGTINDVKGITQMAHDVGALIYVDAVHYAPHGPIDVQDLGCDFLVCSAYKFFGPHIGALYGRYELLDRLPAYKVRPAPDKPPDKFETGTQNHEGMAGVLATVDYLAALGESYGAPFADRFPGFSGQRFHLKKALAAIHAYEAELMLRLIEGLEAIPGLKIWGITDPQALDRRVPTLSFTMEGFTPREIADYLGERGIFTWDGNFYALAVTERLGLEEHGGLLRVGLAHYNTSAEIERLLDALDVLATSPPTPSSSSRRPTWRRC